MIPEKKAIELVYKFIEHPTTEDGNNAIKYAKITVDEIQNIKSVYNDSDLYDYWEEVKQEINKL